DGVRQRTPGVVLGTSHREHRRAQTRIAMGDPFGPPRPESLCQQRIRFPAPAVVALARAVVGEVAQPLARQTRVLGAAALDELLELGVRPPVKPFGRGAALIEMGTE